MHRFAFLYLAILAAAIALVFTVRAAGAQDCGPLPEEPQAPNGCLYVRPVCACQGYQCRTVWVCAQLTPDLEPRFPQSRRTPDRRSIWIAPLPTFNDDATDNEEGEEQ